MAEISDCLDPRCVCALSGSTKSQALDELVDRLCEVHPGLSKAEIEEAVGQRESLMSTGIGLGIGVPHVRLEAVSSLSMAVGIHPTGVEDYESLDGEPVRIIVLIVGGKKQHSDYIRLLANLVAVLKDEALRQSLLSATTTEEVYRLLVGSPEPT